MCDQLRALFDEAPIGVSLVGTDGRFLMVNRAICEIFGRSRARLLSTNLAELTHSDDVRAERPHLARLLSGTTSRYHVDQRCFRSDGRLVWAHASVSLVRGPDGRPDYLIRHVDDITDDKVAEAVLVRAKQRLEEAFDNAAIAKALVDLNGRYLQVNAAMCALVGYDATALTEMTLQELTHPDDLAEDLARMQRLLDGQRRSYSLEKRYLHRDGHVVWALVTGSLVRDEASRPLNFIVQSQDLDARKRAESELAAAQREQERHAAELQLLNAELARSNADLEQFAHVVSHDLQAPLRTVGGFVDLLIAALGDDATVEAREYAGFAVAGVEQMSHMISALLDYSRVGRQDNESALTDLNAVLARVLDALHASIAESGATIVSGALPTVVGDPHQLEHLILNLVDNALKFRSRDRRPEITITSTRLPEGWEIAVRDNGIGISTGDIVKIFGVFARLHPVDAYPGTGIGLAICKKIVECRGGSIEVTSQPGHGTTFVISLPDAPPCARPEPSRRSDAHSPSPPRRSP